MLQKLKTHLLLLMMPLFVLAACQDGSDDISEPARFQVRLTDAPGDYEEVNVEILDVKIHVSDDEVDDDDDGWQDLDLVNSGVYNLLDLTNGNDTLLATDELPAGKISQIRLILGNNNTIKLHNGEMHDMKTPSAQQSGLKLKINATLEPGIEYVVLLDFDASRSVVKAGNSGQYILKPVIRTITQAASGIIEGTVEPAAAMPAVMAISADMDTVGTTANDAGEFMIKGLKAGTYKVVFEPAEGYDSKTIEDVSVSLGEKTDLGTVIIDETL